MAQLTDLEKVRRQRAKRRMVRNLFALAFVALLALACVWLIRRTGEIDLKTAYSDIKAEIATGSGYPVALPDAKISSLVPIGETLALLSDTNIYTYNASGKQIMNFQHGMVNRAAAVSRDRLLLYDRGGTRMSLLSKSSLLRSMTTEYKIYNADIAQNGNVAVATGSGEYLAQVTVYNKNAQEIFKWYSSEKPVICVSLSDTRDTMIAGCVGVSEGDYQSSISLFRFSIDKEMNRAELPGELLLTADYSGGSTIRAVTDKRVVLFNSDLKEIVSYEFGEQKLNRFSSPSDGLLVLVLGNYAEDKQLTVVALDSQLQELGRFSTGDDIIGLDSDQNFIYIAAKDEVEILRPDGSPAAVTAAGNLFGIRAAGGLLYYVTNSSIDVIDIKSATAPPEEDAEPSSGAVSASASAGAQEPESSDASRAEADGAADDANSEAASSGVPESSSLPEESVEAPDNSTSEKPA